jgi:hypothetical protein
VKSTPLDFHPGALKYYKEKKIKVNWVILGWVNLTPSALLP